MKNSREIPLLASHSENCMLHSFRDKKHAKQNCLLFPLLIISVQQFWKRKAQFNFFKSPKICLKISLLLPLAASDIRWWRPGEDGCKKVKYEVSHKVFVSPRINLAGHNPTGCLGRWASVLSGWKEAGCVCVCVLEREEKCLRFI